MSNSVALTPWSLDDHDLLHALNSDPAQMAHVGGVETDAKIADRNALGFRFLGEERFEYPPGTFITVNDWRIDL